jgi:hypothetical protein
VRPGQTRAEEFGSLSVPFYHHVLHGNATPQDSAGLVHSQVVSNISNVYGKGIAPTS